MSQLTEFNQNNLLFKRFQGQIQTLIIPPNNYAGESGAKSLSNVFNDTIFSSDVSSNIAQNFTVFNLDAGPINSGNPNVPNVPDTSANSFSTGIYGFIDISNTTNLRFYKRIFLTSVSSTPFAWWLIDPSSADPTTTNNLLKDMIPFAYNDLDLAMFTPIVYYYTGSVPPGPGDEDNPNNWTSVEQQQPPLYWLVDYESGVLQLYAQLDGSGKISGTEIVTPSTYPPQAYQVPRISFIKYIGDKGAAPIGGGGSDISGVDISNIQINLEKLNRMILPDGYVDISGTDYDLCGNEVVRTYYTYNRAQMFVGYDNLPILDGSAVDHSQDPSHNNIKYELDISGNFFIDGNIDLSYNKIRDVSSIIFRENIDILTFDSSWNKSIHIGNLDENTNDFSGNRILVGSDRYPIHIGYNAGPKDLSGNTIAIGREAGANIQFANSIAIGREAGQNQHDNSIAIGRNAGLDQSANGIAIGRQAGKTQKVHSIAIGREAGQIQYENSIAIGRESGLDQSANSIAIGRNAGKNQKFNAIAIGRDAGQNQEDNTIAIGKNAGVDQSANSIILNAQSNNISLNSNSSGLYVAPIRGPIPDTHLLYYDNNSKEITYGNWKVSGDLDLSCNNIIDVSNIYFCNTSAILAPGSGDLKLATNTTTTSVNHITCKAGIPPAGTGALVGIGNSNPQFALDVNGDSNLSQNAFVSKNPTQSEIIVDKNLYTRNTNLIDTLKINFDTFFNNIWLPMIKANLTGTYTSPSSGQIYNLTQPNPGKAAAVPTFSSAWGPCVIPIAYLDINQNYIPTPFAPGSGQPFQGIGERPYIANTCAYFTIKFAQPYDNNSTNPAPVDWKTASLYVQNGGTVKAGFGAITQQTITFLAGYTDNFKRSPGDDYRKPKPFIKVISTNIPNLKCLNGITTPDGVTAIDIDLVTQNIRYYGYTPDTPKIGGLVRIIIAESCPGIPADKEIRNKAWLLLEQQWNVEPWQFAAVPPVDNTNIIHSLVGDHIIDVRMYANNLGDLNETRNPPFSNQYNTDWQLVTEKSIQEGQQFSWDKFVLPMGTYAIPPVFNIPTIVPPTDVPFTLMVGGTECPNPLTGQLDGVYPQIIPGANLWEVWLNLKDWPYGITTTEEVFESNVDIYGNVIIDGNLDVQDITCNNLDALNSIDVGPNQKLTFTENSIVSTVTATGWAPTVPSAPGLLFNPGLELKAENFYFDCVSTATTRGFIVSLARNDGDSIFRIVDNNNNSSISYGGYSLFQVEGSGLVQTQNIEPWTDMCYNLGRAPNRYKTLYVGNIDASENVDIGGNLTVDGNLKVIDLSATNIDISNNLNVLGHTLVTDLSATNIDVSNNLNVEGLIIGVAKTTFVEYRDYTDDIPQNISDWYCIARTKDTNPGGGADNARGLFILDDNTSGRRQQIIFYAGTSYSRGNYINVIANNWYGSTPTITNLKLETGGIYDGTNLYIYRVATTTADRVYVRLYENTRLISTGGQWELTTTPISGLSNTPVNLDITYNPNNQRANSCSSLDHSFQGDVSMNTLNLSNLDVQNTIKTKILEVEDSAGNDVLKVDGPNKTSTFYFDSSTSSGSLILNDTNGNTSTFIKQQGTTVVMEGSDLQVGSVGAEKDINAAEVTGWFNTRDYYSVARVIGVDSGGGMPQPLYMSQITNNCPGSIELITTSGATNSVQPQATGVYTVTITGVWTGSGNPWSSGSDTGQPMILMYGPAYHTSAPGGITTVQMLSLQSSSRFYNSGYTDYLSFNWTGRMVHQFNGAQAQYSFYCKENGGGSTGTQTYTGQLQVTRIC
jgi:hypothetical protein